MPDSWLVLKFGGSSVSGRWQWDTIASLLSQRLDAGYRVVLVCSALQGVTNSLQTLADDAHATDIDDLNSILERHRQFALDLGVEAEDLIVQAGRDIRQALRSLLDATPASERYSAVATL